MIKGKKYRRRKNCPIPFCSPPAFEWSVMRTGAMEALWSHDGKAKSIRESVKECLDITGPWVQPAHWLWLLGFSELPFYPPLSFLTCLFLAILLSSLHTPTSLRVFEAGMEWVEDGQSYRPSTALIKSLFLKQDGVWRNKGAAGSPSVFSL